MTYFSVPKTIVIISLVNIRKIKNFEKGNLIKDSQDAPKGRSHFVKNITNFAIYNFKKL